MSELSPTESAWARGLTVFAAVMMMAVGIFQALQGLVALFNSEFYVVGREYTFEFDVTAWGWFHLLLGAGVGVAGVFLYLGATWARWTAIVLVGLSMLANFMWLPYYPIWGLVILALDVAVVWAIVSTD
jgi:hypothetical protein